MVKYSPVGWFIRVDPSDGLSAESGVSVTSRYEKRCVAWRGANVLHFASSRLNNGCRQDWLVANYWGRGDRASKERSQAIGKALYLAGGLTSSHCANCTVGCGFSSVGAAAVSRQFTASRGY